MPNQSRRNFLATIGATALAVVGAHDSASATEFIAPRRRLARVGLQLYTVRDQMKADMPGTIARVAAIGYKEVEFAGYFGRTPRQVRDMLRRNGLTSPSTHLGFDVLEKDFQKTLDEAKEIGHQWVTFPFIPEDRRKTLADWRSIATLFNRSAEQARKNGLRFAYHNHDMELRDVEGMRPLDVLLQHTDPALVDFEMDIYWVVFGGGDPLDFINRYPGRFPLVHVKDSAGPPDNKMADVGRGTINWPKIFAQSQRAGIKHYFVEHDQPADPMQSIRNSFRYLNSLRY